MIEKLLKIVPWLIVMGFVTVYFIGRLDSNQTSTEVINYTDVISKKVESLGKMELSKHHFKEIVERKRISKEYFNLFKLGNDAKIVLICNGEAVGCIDFTLIKEDDVFVNDSIVHINLPSPELCYHKLDLQKTRIYSLETNLFIDQSKFIQEAYKIAEVEIKKAAIASDILLDTKRNAQIILKPILEELTQKKIELYFKDSPYIGETEIKLD